MPSSLTVAMAQLEHKLKLLNELREEIAAEKRAEDSATPYGVERLCVVVDGLREKYPLEGEREARRPRLTIVQGGEDDS